MDWRDKIVDSSLFYIRSGHENPKEFPIRNRIQVANNVMIGSFRLSDTVKSEISNYFEITSDTRPEDPSIKLHSGLYYHCADVFNPEIGDIRLQFLTAGVESNFVCIFVICCAKMEFLLCFFFISLTFTICIFLSLLPLNDFPVYNRCKI